MTCASAVLLCVSGGMAKPGGGRSGQLDFHGATNGAGLHHPVTHHDNYYSGRDGCWFALHRK